MKSPLFSVIVPTYNSEKTLLACLNSIIKQSYSNFEILIIDGLSTDKTIEIGNGCNDGRIRIHSEKDRGIYDAMNKGIRLAEGKWLYFLGSDDTLYNSAVLDEICSILISEECNVVYGNSRIIGNTPWAKNGTIYDGKFDLKKLLTKNICHQAIFYRTYFIKTKIGYFNLNYTMCSDWDFNLKCWSKSPFKYIDKIISNFYGGGKSTHSIYDKRLADDYPENLITYFPLFLLKESLSEEMFNYCYSFLNRATTKNKLKRFIKSLLPI